MRILFVKSNLDRSELDMVLKIHAQGIYIKVLSSKNAKYKKELKDVGIYIACNKVTSKFNWSLIKKIRSLVSSEKFDIIHASQSSELANSIWATYDKRIKIVAYRGTLAKIRRHDPTYWLAILNPRVSRIICVNKSIYNYLSNFFSQKKLLVNYKGYDIDWANELINEDAPIENLPNDAFVVMYIASTKNRPYKGLDELTKAIHFLNNPKVHFVFIGNYNNASLALAKNGVAGKRIHFLGEQPNAAKFLKHAHLFVLPSLRDGLPRVLKEAMAQEVPLIVTNIPGPSELVQHKKTGLIVNPADAKAMAEAITYYTANEKERIQAGKNGKNYLVECFSSKLFTEKTIALYKEVYNELHEKSIS